jgi:hypothetical protein
MEAYNYTCIYIIPCMLLVVRESLVSDSKLPMLLDREPPKHAAQLVIVIVDGLPLEHITPPQALVDAPVHTSLLLGTSPEHFHPDSTVCVEPQRRRPWQR